MRSLTVWETSTSEGPASAPTRAPMCTAMPLMSVARVLDFAGVHAGSDLDAEVAHVRGDRRRAVGCARGAIEEG